MKSGFSKNLLKNLNSKVFGKHFSAKVDHGAKQTKQAENISKKFHDIYVKELERLNNQRNQATKAEYKPEQNHYTSSYQHPYHSDKFPVYWSTKNMYVDGENSLGAEPVSPHYESFVMSRRFPLLMSAFLCSMSYLEAINLSSFYGNQMVYEIYTIAIVTIGFNESRYIITRLPLPRLTWYYDSFAVHELKQIKLNWFDSIEETTQKHLQATKEQLDYYLIHKEYNFVKKRVLTSFLENQRKALTKHFQERTFQMLSSIENYENNNIKGEVSRIADEAYKNVIKILNDSSKNKDIIDSSFESALSGLEKGEMKYENDKVVPLYLNEVTRLSESLLKMSPEEENKKFALTASQRSSIADLDKRAKVDYLSKEPEVATTIKNTELYKTIVNRIKGKANAI